LAITKAAAPYPVFEHLLFQHLAWDVAGPEGEASMKKWLPISAFVLTAAILTVPARPVAQTRYVPQPQFCANGSNALCAVLPGYIGPDPRLGGKRFDYQALSGPLPTKASDDLQTPFDNMAWQMFVALNWVVDAGDQIPATGLTAPGRRVWQTYRKVSEVFGDSPVRARCTNPLALPVFYIGSNGQGKPIPNNEEYFQASTNLPLIDINGNWTIFERRVNDIEASYILSPNGQSSQTLTTIPGQSTFITQNPGGVQFTSSATTPDGGNGSIEIKAAWRIIDRASGDDPSRYYTQNALLAVPGDLVRGGRPFCSDVTLGLVGMHIIQRNPENPNATVLFPQWIWATFEHVDNAPKAQAPCNVGNGCGTDPKTNWINQASCGAAAPSRSVRYSFFRPNSDIQGTNIAPVALLQEGADKTQPQFRFRTQYPWNPRPPYARGATSAATAMPQAVRCWEIYPTTDQLNTQWQKVLGGVNSVFRNYMLIGTQWGASSQPLPGNPVPTNAVPGMLSNITLETYIQNYTGSNPDLPGPGSCVGCHSFATLPADNKTSANFSFLPFLAQPATARSKIKTAQ
jgi:hypothetical protein